MLKIMTDRNHSTLMIMAIVMSSLIYPIHSLLSASDAEAAENISMTLTELSVFMKKQELELQLRTEKEKEEGEYLWQLAAPRSADTFLLKKKKISGKTRTEDFSCLGRTMSDYQCKLVGCVKHKQIKVSPRLPVSFWLQPPSQKSC